MMKSPAFLRNFFFGNMLAYVSLEPQFNVDQSFPLYCGLKCTVSEIKFVA